jgi:predicted DNA-binding transcriptional regulator YafY
MFRTSRRTIFRDLKELQSINIPYHYNHKAGGYYIDPEFFLPPIDLNLQEALSLLLLVHKAGIHLQLPHKNSAILAAIKIENNLPQKIRHYCHTSMKNISMKVSATAPMNLLDNMFTQLHKAIQQKKKVPLLLPLTL